MQKVDCVDDRQMMHHLAVSNSLHCFLSNFHTKGPSGHLASRVFSSKDDDKNKYVEMWMGYPP